MDHPGSEPRRLNRESHWLHQATCTACVWLALYGVAIAGAFFLSSGQQKHETPVVAAVKH